MYDFLNFYFKKDMISMTNINISFANTRVINKFCK